MMLDFFLWDHSKGIVNELDNEILNGASQFTSFLAKCRLCQNKSRFISIKKISSYKCWYRELEYIGFYGALSSNLLGWKWKLIHTLCPVLFHIMQLVKFRFRFDIYTDVDIFKEMPAEKEVGRETHCINLELVRWT